MKRSRYWIIGIAGVLLGSQLVLPLVAETMIERSLMRSVESEQMMADVSSLPAMSLIGGSADEIVLAGKRVRVGRVLCDEIHAQLSDIKIDMPHLMQDGKLLLHHVGDAKIMASITEEDLAQALRHSVKQLDEPTVTITPEGIEASGVYAFGRASAKMMIRGRLDYDKNKIYFVSEQVQLQYGTMGNFSAELKTKVELADIGHLPFAVRITEIRPTNGRILLAFQRANELQAKITRFSDSYEVEHR